MRRNVQLTMRRSRQPGVAAWEAAARLAEHFATSSAARVHVIDGIAISLDFSSEEDATLEAVLTALRDEARRTGLTWDDYRTTQYGPDDVRAADLVIITGVGVDDGDARFLLSEAEALGVESSCPQCGTRRVTHRSVRPLVRVDPTLIQRAASTVSVDGTVEPARSPDESWDAINLVNGALVVSPRLIAALKRSGATGWTTDRVADATGASLDLWMLRATTVDARVCPEHSALPPSSVCPTCGTVLAEQSRGRLLHVPEAKLAGLDVVSYGFYDHGPLAVRPRIIDAWREAGVEGISVILPLIFCRH